MISRLIGGLEVSAMGLGCNQLGTRCDANQSDAIVGRALDLGVTFFDTAEEYGDGLSEKALGASLRGRRQEVVIATKFGGFREGVFAPGRASAGAIIRAIEGSLRRLKTDYIDLYQVHFPDPETPIEETLATLDSVVRSGKVREIGCCNFSEDEIDEAADVAAAQGITSFAVSQNRFNLLRQEAADRIIPACVRRGMSLLPYFPLAAGLLTGKYRQGEAPSADTRMGSRFVDPETSRRVLKAETLERVRRLEAFAAAHGGSVLNLAIAWLLSNPIVGSVIAGATRPEQVECNVRALDWTLSSKDMAPAAAIGLGIDLPAHLTM